MKEKIRLNQKQLTMLMANLLIVKIIFAFPRNLFKTSGNAAWIEAIYLTAIAAILLEVTFLTYKSAGKKSIIQLAESIGGKPLKIIVSLIVVIVIGGFLCTEVRTFAESVKIILLPSTSIEVIMLLFAVTAGIGAWYGMEALATINAIFFPFCLFFLGVLVVWLVPNYNLNNLMPVLGLGGKNIFLYGIKNLSCFADILVLNLILPYCKDVEMVKKSGRYAVLTAGIALVAISLAYGMCYPYPFSADFLLTAYQLSRMARAGEYFQRFEALFELVWTITHLLYSSIYVYIICNVLKEGFKVKYSEPLIPCVAALVALVSFEPSSVMDLLEVSSAVKQIFFPFAYVLPIVVPIIYVHKRRKNNEKM
ncbi:MAG: hypothetical protein E7417_01690 [Ruminococcaceae bacterium]|nr:hypothetical protein [Oscillospiraceae bacterium]